MRPMLAAGLHLQCRVRPTPARLASPPLLLPLQDGPAAPGHPATHPDWLHKEEDAGHPHGDAQLDEDEGEDAAHKLLAHAVLSKGCRAAGVMSKQPKRGKVSRHERGCRAGGRGTMPTALPYLRHSLRPAGPPHHRSQSPEEEAAAACRPAGGAAAGAGAAAEGSSLLPVEGTLLAALALARRSWGPGS